MEGHFGSYGGLGPPQAGYFRHFGAVVALLRRISFLLQVAIEVQNYDDCDELVRPR